jgi:peroxiredoxin Q/BCP
MSSSSQSSFLAGKAVGLSWFILTLGACESRSAPAAGPSSASSGSVEEATAASTAPAQAVASSVPAVPGPPLDVGSNAPLVTLTLQDGKRVALAELRGAPVVVYFYPKDDTPGCTVEAKGIRDAYAEFEKAKLRVFGVSTQGAESHQQFIDKYSLPFDLVVDEDGAVARAFGVPLRGEFASRQTFLIDADGKIKKTWPEVDPAGHAQEILASLE